jgi:hypothetical protein
MANEREMLNKLVEATKKQLAAPMPAPMTTFEEQAAVMEEQRKQSLKRNPPRTY